MEQQNVCSKCGKPAAAGDSPLGLCDDCLLHVGLGEAADTVPMPGRATLSPDEIAPLFPQLEILECLGRGGMGVVFKARQKSLNRLVALKLLAPDRAGDALFARRFAKEAQALAALNHPNIVTIYDFGQAGGYCYLLMEYVDGATLRQAMRAAKFTPAQALAVVPQICDALQYAHEHGVVHRDIKPENLLLDKEGRVKIADFGIAKMLNADADGTCATETIAGGTPRYTAPEQWEGRGTDHRADIYSLGVVFYELLTGELPSRPIDPPSKKVAIDVRLDAVVLHALEENPDRRYQTVAEVKTMVEAAAAPAPQARGKRALAGLGIALAAACALAAVWTALNRMKPAKPATASQPTAHSPQPTAFSYTTNNGTITITKYTGPGGSVTIPSSVNGLPVNILGENAFYNCENLTNVSIPNGVTDIRPSAFIYCYKLASITIPDSVTSIGTAAFFCCTGLTNITIPKGVTLIDGGAFAFCEGLTSIKVDTANPAYCSSEDGVLFDKAKTRLIQCPGGKTGSYAIPSSVTAIGISAFGGRSKLTRITIPNSITNIGDFAFDSCADLTSLTIPESVVSVGRGAFQFSGLTNCEIPKSVVSIGYYAFAECRKLDAVSVDAVNPAYCSDEGVLFDKTRKRLVSYPGGKAGSYAIPNGVTEIAPAAFKGCRYLPTVTLPASTARVGVEAFANCGDLAAVCFNGNAPWADENIFAESKKVIVYHRPGTTGWGPTFGGRPTAVWQDAPADASQPTAHSLQPSASQCPYTYTTNNGAVTITKYTGPGGEVVIPGTINGLPVTSLGYCSFGRSDLTSLTIPDSVTRFEAFALYGCGGLTNLTIPKSVTTIESGCFGWCNKVLSFKVDEANPVYSSEDGIVFNKEKTRLLHYPPGRAGNYVVSDRIASIGSDAFTTCANLTGITIPNSVTHIGMSAFSECSSLTNFVVPASVASIGAGVFRGCKGLNSLVVDAANPVFSSTDGILFNKEKTSLLWYPDGRAGSYSIPDSVTHIGDSAFQRNSLTNVVISARVTRIGDLAFHSSAKLTSLTIPESVTNIGYYGAFGECPNLTNIVIQTDMASIPANAFAGCRGLISFTVDAANAAYNSAGGALFNKDKTLLICCPGGTAGSYEIPPGVTRIGSSAFHSCGSLINVMVPNSVTDIGSDAFRNCGNLKGVYFKGHAPLTGDNVFAESGKVVVHYQPDSMGWDAEFGGRATAVWRAFSMAGAPSVLPSFGTSQNVVPGVPRRIGSRSPGQRPNPIALPAIPTAVTAQGPFTCTTNNGTITITKYTGPGGEVVIPGTINGQPVTGVAGDAFWGCTNATCVTIPASVTSLGSNPFASHWSGTHSKLLSIVVDTANPAYCSTSDGVVFNKDKTLLVSYPGAKAGDYVIPEGVTSIGNFAFNSCYNLTSVTIPIGVTNIGGQAFRVCPALTSVTIPASITSIGENPFAGCSRLATVVVDAANPACLAEDGVLFDKQKTRLIGCSACKVGSYVIPDSVTSIDSCAFDKCSNLTSVTIPNNVTNIGDCAFYDCSTLTHFTIPRSITGIGSCVFVGCRGLTNITIPNNITSIGYAAFTGCIKLNSIYFQGNAPRGGSDGSVFDGAKNATVYYRPGTKGWGPTFGGRPTKEWKP